MKNRMLILAMASLLNSCGGKPVFEGSQIGVDNKRAVCTGEGQQLCLRIKYNEHSPYQNYYDQIEGFDYVWGKSYQLLYEQQVVEDPPQDGSSLKLILLEVLSVHEDLPGMQYVYLGVELGDWTISFDDGAYQFLGQPFECSVGLDCDSLLMLKGTGREVDLEFSYLGDGKIQLDHWD